MNESGEDHPISGEGGPEAGDEIVVGPIPSEPPGRNRRPGGAFPPAQRPRHAHPPDREKPPTRPYKPKP